METKNIVNLVHFIRAANSRDSDRVAVREPLFGNLEMMEKYNIPLTVLLQYDALVDEDFNVPLLERAGDSRLEIGLWLECPKVLVEDAGMPWRGREGFTWDWHTHVSYLIGYTPEERFKLLDTAMAKFYEIFGYYPKVIGCWMLDATSLGYLAEKYPSVQATCICRDQWGTDGMSLWGGYDSIYYPSRRNMLAPASTKEEQVPIPMFRMLVNDPMYNYDIDYIRSRLPELGGNCFFTLEPYFAHGGSSEHWVDWMFSVLQDSDTQPYSYAQIGQENGFLWSPVAKGLEYQCQLVAKLAAEGKVCPQHMSESGRWFKEQFPVTPVNMVSATTDWTDHGRQSTWYYSKEYRLNLFFDEDMLRIRDWRQFRDDLAERYLENICTQHGCLYTTPALMDGFRWSDDSRRAGIYPVRRVGESYQPVTGQPTFRTTETTLQATVGDFSVLCEEGRVTLTAPADGAWMLMAGDTRQPTIGVEGDRLTIRDLDLVKGNDDDCKYYCAAEGLTAVATLRQGTATLTENGLLLLPKESKIQLGM